MLADWTRILPFILCSYVAAYWYWTFSRKLEKLVRELQCISDHTLGKDVFDLLECTQIFKRSSSSITYVITIVLLQFFLKQQQNHSFSSEMLRIWNAVWLWALKVSCIQKMQILYSLSQVHLDYIWSFSLCCRRHLPRADFSSVSFDHNPCWF